MKEVIEKFFSLVCLYNQILIKFIVCYEVVHAKIWSHTDHLAFLIYVKTAIMWVQLRSIKNLVLIKHVMNV